MKLLRALVAVLLAAVLAPPALAGDEACFECHGQAAPDGSYMPIVRAADYAAGVHAPLPCATCHEAEEGGWDVVPHKLVTQRVKACMDCHAEEFTDIQAEFDRGRHAGGERPFPCSRCHDVHRMLKDVKSAPPDVRRRQANGPCIDCHRETVVEVGGREGAVGVRMAHDWLPHPESHAKMRCIVCHSPPNESGIHEVLGKEGSARDCAQCHAESSELIDKFVGRDDRSTWITNPGLFEYAYVRGATRNRLVDKILIGLLLATVVGIAAHALARVVLVPKRSAPYVVKEVALYSALTRIGHWLNALLVIVLMATGLRLHFGGRAGALIEFETAFHTHNLVGAMLVVMSIVFVVVHVAGGGVKQYLHFRNGHVAGSIAQARWYLLGIFKGDPHPTHATPERRFNPLQQTAYASLMWGALPVLVVTGILLLYPQTIPEQMVGQDGKWLVSTIHYLVSWAFVLFLVGHLYLITLGDKVGYALTAMITGVHRHHEPAPAPGDTEDAADAD